MYHIVNAVLYFAEMLIVYTYISDIFEKKFSTLKTMLIGSLVFAVPYTVNEIKNHIVINVAMYAISIFAFLMICYKSTIKQNIIHSLILTGTMAATELICMYSVSIFFGKYTYFSYRDNFSIYILDVITSKLLYLIVCKIISRFKVKNELKLQKIPISYYFYALASFGLIFSILIINQNVKFENTLQILIIVTSSLLLFSIIFIFISYESAAEKNAEYMELKNEMNTIEIDKQYYSILQSKNDEMHQLVHDMKHHLSTIDTLSKSDEVNEYISEIYHDLDVYSSIGKTNNKILDLIINKYISLCDIKGVNFDINIKTANLKELKNDDLSSLMNNILDNALESASKSESKTISLSINRKQTFTMLTCVNSCDTSPVSVKGNLKTTKNDKETNIHGYGTKSIARIVNKYNGEYEWQYLDDTNEFVTTIMIP